MTTRAHSTAQHETQHSTEQRRENHIARDGRALSENKKRTAVVWEPVCWAIRRVLRALTLAFVGDLRFAES
jgi:hypothetical protein